MESSSTQKFTLCVASECDRNEIYKIRYDVYAWELNQHAANPYHELRDDLDMQNLYIVAKRDEKVIDFLSITPPLSKKYSIDKYFARSSIPYAFDETFDEVRLLTIVESSARVH